MLKKFKLLLILIVLTGSGIVIVLGFWLYGSYNNRFELLMSSAERSLFNVVQGVFQEENGGQDTVAQNSNKAKIRSSFYHKGHKHFKREDGPIQLIPPFLFSNKGLTDSMLKQINQQIKLSFEQKGLPLDYRVEVVELQEAELKALRISYRKDRMAWTRPMLVNPDKGQFLILKFTNEWKYLWFNLSWQLLIAFLLIGLLIGTFFYLILTIVKQNRLAILRKSFVNNMTHELKTPVSIVMAAVEAIQRYVDRDDKAKMNRYLDISKRELSHLSNLIERVLEVDMDEVNGVQLDLKSIELNMLIKNSINPFEEVFNKKPISIEFLASPNPIFIRADEAHLKNVFSNLLDNSIKYSEDQVIIKIAITDLGEQVEISFQDFGKGIAKKDQQQIFDLFYRVPQGNLHDVKGFGIGLSYVRQIIEKHQGTVEVYSELGSGATFTVRIPKA